MLHWPRVGLARPRPRARRSSRAAVGAAGSASVPGPRLAGDARRPAAHEARAGRERTTRERQRHFASVRSGGPGPLPGRAAPAARRELEVAARVGATTVRQPSERPRAPARGPPSRRCRASPRSRLRRCGDSVHAERARARLRFGLGGVHPAAAYPASHGRQGRRERLGCRSSPGRSRPARARSGRWPATERPCTGSRRRRTGSRGTSSWALPASTLGGSRRGWVADDADRTLIRRRPGGPACVGAACVRRRPIGPRLRRHLPLAGEPPRELARPDRTGDQRRHSRRHGPLADGDDRGRAGRRARRLALDHGPRARPAPPLAVRGGARHRRGRARCHGRRRRRLGLWAAAFTPAARAAETRLPASCCAWTRAARSSRASRQAGGCS